VRRAIPLLVTMLFAAWAIAAPVPCGDRSAAAHLADDSTPLEVITASCESNNPYYVGAALAEHGDALPSVIAFQDTNANDVTAHLTLATRAQVGAIYGLAYDQLAGDVYAAAYHMRGDMFGTGGPGAIYAIDLSTGTTRLWTVVEAGPDLHGTTTPRNFSWAPDDLANPWVGKTSLADVEVDSDARLLYVMNLFDRRIHVLSMDDARTVATYPHGAAAEPWAENARPFGLGLRHGWLYHGVVDSRERSELPGTLSGHVYRSRWDGREIARVATFELSYSHFPAWRSWMDSAARLVEPQPLIADIEFRRDGDLVLGLRDRTQDMFGTNAGLGDLLPTRRTQEGRWEVVTTPEFYRDFGPRGGYGWEHIDEPSWGGLAAVPRRDEVLATVWNPVGVSLDWGVQWFDNDTGEVVGPTGVGETTADNEGRGLGDIEPLCSLELPTPTPTATATTPTPTPSPTASATPSLRPIYLPLVTKRCPVRLSYADVTLVLDLSTSMLRPTDARRTKLEAVQDAAETFLDRMDLSGTGAASHDRVAVIGFNDSAWVARGLTSDRASLSAAIQGLPSDVAEGTRLDLALDRALEAFSGPPRSRDRLPAVILLTDGLPNRVPTPVPTGSQDDTVLRAAERLHAARVRVYAIGVGRPEAVDPADRINPRLLAQVATQPSGYFEIPDAEALSAIYSEIAGGIACLSRLDP